MKSSLYSVLLILAVATSSAIAKEDKAEPMSDRQFEKIQKHVELSDEQIEEITSIRNSGGTRKEVRAVLTKDQRMKLKQAREQRNEAKDTAKTKN